MCCYHEVTDQYISLFQIFYIKAIGIGIDDLQPWLLLPLSLVMIMMYIFVLSKAVST